jgi:2',3'-cyclic-nucleotide 2'-phosphodiesterase (5'-nucleotidase family)
VIADLTRWAGAGRKVERVRISGHRGCRRGSRTRSFNPHIGWLLLGLLLISVPTHLSARQVTLTILHTTDLHGHVWPARDYDGTEGVGGLLRCATLIEELRLRYPQALLVDCGDLYQGGMESYLTQGRIMNQALDWLGYDAWVPGNHEFDWGIEVLADTLRQSRVPVIAANIGVRPGRVNPLPGIRPYVIRNVEGVRVALVGLTTEAIPQWSRPHLLGDVVFEDSVEALRRILPQVRAERPDVMILLVHQGYRPFGDRGANQVNRIARHFPEFDLILGGHSHQAVGEALVNGILYSQAGYYGIWLGQVQLVYDTVSREVVQRQAQVTHVDEGVSVHEELQSVLAADLDRARAYRDRLVGAVAEPVRARSRVPGQSEVQQLIARAVAAATGAEVVLHGTLSGESLAAGTVYERDLWRLVPYENTIGKMMLTAAELRELLEENIDWIRSSQFMGVYGITYELHETEEPGQRVRNLRLADGSAIHARRRLSVALNSYVLASGGGRFPAARRLADQPLSRLEMTGVDTRSAVREYIVEHSPLQIDDGSDLVRRIRSSD